MTSHRLAGLALSAVVALAIAGCSADNAPAPDKSPELGDAQAATSPATPVPSAPVVGKDGVAGAKADLSSSSCAFADGAWSMKGTLTNSQKAAQDYAIRVSVRDTTTSSVKVAKVFNKKVEPGKSVKVSGERFLEAASSDGTDCVISVTRQKA